MFPTRKRSRTLLSRRADVTGGTSIPASRAARWVRAHRAQPMSNQPKEGHLGRYAFSLFFALAATASLVAVPSSPADARIAAAQSRVGANAKSWQPYIDLAAALCRKARDTEDVT